VTEHSGETTRLLRQAFEDEDAGARSALFESLHAELKQMARAAMQKERGGHSWQASDLLQECVVQLLAQQPHNLSSRPQFFAAVRNTMRRLLVDHARHRKTLKAGGQFSRTMLDDRIAWLESNALEIAMFDEALEKLKAAHPRQFEIITASVISRLEPAEIAAVLDVSLSTVYDDLKSARVFLHMHLKGSDG
jgi:RNA polymerase sigma factor (TIGR02999 family)